MLLRVWDVTFIVADLRRAVAFYENVLCLPKKYEFSTYAGFDCGGVEIGLQPGTPGKGHRGMPCVDFLVRDVAEVHRVLRKRGVHFLQEPHDVPWGARIAVFTDPDGNLLEIVQIDWRKYLAGCASQQLNGHV